MSRVHFNEEEQLSRGQSKQLRQSSTKMNMLLKKFSFGFIKTDEQAELTKLLIIAFGIIWFGVAFFGSKNDIAVEPPSQELINAPQPGGRR